MYTTVLRYGTRCHRLFRGWYHVLEEEIAAPFPLGGTARIPSYLRRYKGLRAQPPPPLGETEKEGGGAFFSPHLHPCFAQATCGGSPKREGGIPFFLFFSAAWREREGRETSSHSLSPPIPPPLDPRREKSPWGRVGGTLLRRGGELQEAAQNQRI